MSRKIDKASLATGSARRGFSSSRCTSAMTQSSNASCFLIPSSRNFPKASFILAMASGSFLSMTLAMATPCNDLASPCLSANFLKRSLALEAFSRTPSASSRIAWMCASSRSAMAAILSSATSRNSSSARSALPCASSSSARFAPLWSHRHSASASSIAACPRLSPEASKAASSWFANRSASRGLSSNSKLASIRWALTITLRVSCVALASPTSRKRGRAAMADRRASGSSSSERWPSAAQKSIAASLFLASTEESSASIA
mmetsp:Transcript_11514/g.29042  ORF Transcript_11514/g.29042 Transcript_11514/m.29042 type:complete len:261 (-) Transcript_11514:184-966(-)